MRHIFIVFVLPCGSEEGDEKTQNLQQDIKKSRIYSTSDPLWQDLRTPADKPCRRSHLLVKS
jgi:hypothetical protein